MAKKITSLTEAQVARFPEFVDKWIKIGLSTEPADRERAERAIKGLYGLAQLREPRVIWLPCPLSAAMAAFSYYALTAQRRQKTAVGTAVDTAVDTAVRTAVGTAVRTAVGTAVGTAVDTAVGTAVRTAVGTAVGTAVRTAVGTAVGTAKRLSDGDWARAQGAGYSFFGGSLWAGWGWYYGPAACDYYSEVLGVSTDRHYSEAVQSCGYYWLLDDVCFASERPSHINRDEQGRLHCEIGQSIGYRSGWGLWHWHGVQVPQLVVEHPELITVEMIDQERNAEVRRVMIERYRFGSEISGSGAFICDAGGKRVDYDERWGILWRREVPGDEPIVSLEVINRSPEPDGRFRHYFLRCEPELRPLPPGDWPEERQREFLREQAPQALTARNAVASLHGLRGEQYAPSVET
jgi:hypothetical protein